MPREGNVNADGVGIGGGITAGPEGCGHVTVYVEVPDVDPEGHTIGVLSGG